MKKITRLAALALAVLTAASVTSCGEKREEYYKNSLDTGSATLTVAVAYDTGTKGENKKEVYFNDEELDGVFDGAVSLFGSSLEYLASDSSTSQLGEINSRVNSVFDCDSKLVGILNAAYSLSAVTDGAFQPCGGTLSELYSLKTSPTEDEINEALSHTGTDKITFNGNTVTKNDTAAKIDLSSVAAGFAMSEVVAYLEDSGCLYGYVTVDSMAAVFGTPKKGSTFDIGVLSDGETRQGYMRLESGYLSVISASDAAYDCSAGTPAVGGVSRAAVWSDDAMTACAVANAAFILGDVGIRSLYGEDSSLFEAVLVMEDGSVIVTDGAAESGMYAPETTA